MSPFVAARDTLRFVSAHSASNSAITWPSSRRLGGIAHVAARAPRPCASRRPSRDTNAVPRSKLSVTLVTRQPSFSSPTSCSAGTRTSSRNTSQNSDEPSIVSIGRTSMPGRSIGQDEPRDALVLGRVGVGAREQLAELPDLPERAPDLAAGHHVVVAVADGAGREAGEVGAGVGLREALAPHLLARGGSWGCASPSARRCPRRSAWARRAACPRSSRRRTAPSRSSISSRKISCSLGGASRPPYSFGHDIPA